MKTYILLLLLLLPILAEAQTTEEEYNYVTKGYKIQEESGLDMKKGYVLEELGTRSTGERTAKILRLVRVSDNGARALAAFMVIYQKKDAPKDYICVPHPASEQSILEKYWYALWDGNAGTNNSAKLQLILLLLNDQLNWN